MNKGEIPKDEFVNNLVSLINKIRNSRLWFYIYYKHTKKHKKDLKETHDRVMEKRKEAIGK